MQCKIGSRTLIAFAWGLTTHTAYNQRNDPVQIDHLQAATQKANKLIHVFKVIFFDYLLIFPSTMHRKPMVYPVFLFVSRLEDEPSIPKVCIPIAIVSRA